MGNFKIYKNGKYDPKANITLQLSIRIDKFNKRAARRLEEIDYYFVHHEKLVR
jgi:hypothetical protein